MGDPRTDWPLTSESEQGLAARTSGYPRGKVLGGASTINGMIYMRGQAADYDGWRRSATPAGAGTTFSVVQGHEDHFRGGDAFHGSGGRGGSSGSACAGISSTLSRRPRRYGSRRPTTSIAATMTA